MPFAPAALRSAARPAAPPRVAAPSAGRACGLFAAAAGWFVWHVYRPGVMNHDGLWIYAQAVRGTFEDWQPVAVSAAIGFLVKLGLEMHHLTLALAVSVALGVQRLGFRTVRTLYGPLASDRAAHLAGLVSLALLLTPLSPLAYYLTYFGTDGLLLPLFLWFAVGWLAARERFPFAGRREKALRTAGLTALAAAAILARPNAALLVPVFVGLFAALHGRRGWKAAVLAAAVLCAARPAVGGLIAATYSIERTHPEDQVMALDLVGMTILRPEAAADLPFTAAHLDGQRTVDGYAWGVVDPLYPWGHEPIVKPGFARGGHDALAAEYRTAALKYPATLGLVKLRAYAAYLLEPNPYWHNSGIDANDMGLAHGEKRHAVREVHAAADRLVYANPVLQWAGARHAAWLVACAAACGVLLRAGYVAGRPRAAAVGLMLLVPLAYYAAFAAAVTTNHFRFMYPSTLAVQAALVPVGLLAAARAADAAARRGPA